MDMGEKRYFFLFFFPSLKHQSDPGSQNPAFSLVGIEFIRVQGIGVIWAISSFFRGGFTEVSSRVDFIQINQSVAAEGTADPPVGVTFWVAEGG